MGGLHGLAGCGKHEKKFEYVDAFDLLHDQQLRKRYIRELLVLIT